MDYTEKDKAIQKILISLGVQFFPIILYSLLIDVGIITQESTLSTISIFLSFGLLIYGYFLFIKACHLYVKSKGYSVRWGWIGLFSIVGLCIISIIPTKNSSIESEKSQKKLSNNPFKNINLIEFFGFYFINLTLVVTISIYLFAVIINNELTNNFSQIIDKNTPSSNWIFYIITIFFCSLSLRDIKAGGFKFKDFIPNYKIAWQLVIKLSLIYCIFAISFNRLIYYQLSFLFPDYIENLINSNLSISLTIYLLDIFFSIILLPIFELIISLLLQKWSLKWNHKRSLLLLSFVLSVIDFSPSFLSIFIQLVIWYIILFKTANLINIFIFDVFTKLIFNCVYFIFYYHLRFTYIKVVEYQEINQLLLILYYILAIISIRLIIDFIYKNFPKPDAVIPVYKNRNYQNNFHVSDTPS